MANSCQGSKSYTDWQYRLRAGSPMPTDSAGSFKLHTFGVERTKIKSVAYTDTLPESSEFRGNSTSGEYISASFSRLPDSGGRLFSGKITYSPEVILGTAGGIDG